MTKSPGSNNTKKFSNYKKGKWFLKNKKIKKPCTYIYLYINIYTYIYQDILIYTYITVPHV